MSSCCAGADLSVCAATRNPRYVVERITKASSSGDGDRSGDKSLQLVFPLCTCTCAGSCHSLPLLPDRTVADTSLCSRANVVFREDETLDTRFRSHLSDYRQSGCVHVCRTG